MAEPNTLLVTKSKEEADALRTAVMRHFDSIRPWVCIFIQGDEYRITVDGPWGSRMIEADENKVKSFAKQFHESKVKTSKLKS